MTDKQGTTVQVQTVTGLVDVSDIGVTLTHEHLYADFSDYVWQPEEAWKRELARTPVGAEIAWALREDPFFHPDNCRLDDVDASVEELGLFQAAGGRTVVEVTNPGIGRDPLKLVEISNRTGMNIVMGSTWYIGTTHDESLRHRSIDDLAAELLTEVNIGVSGTGVRPGVLGELGISEDFTASEERCLRAAARAQVKSGLPLLIHLPGWHRLGGRVLDVIEEEGAPSSAVVLGHMNPSGRDREYQEDLLNRGAWLAFDMTGMGFYYADHGGQAPSPDEDAVAVAGLISSGFGSRVLLSHDVFVKAMWTRNGGNGFGYIPNLFLPRLVRRHGISAAVAASLLTENPAAVFVAAAHAKRED